MHSQYTYIHARTHHQPTTSYDGKSHTLYGSYHLNLARATQPLHKPISQSQLLYCILHIMYSQNNWLLQYAIIVQTPFFLFSLFLRHFSLNYIFVLLYLLFEFQFKDLSFIENIKWQDVILYIYVRYALIKVLYLLNTYFDKFCASRPIIINYLYFFIFAFWNI